MDKLDARKQQYKKALDGDSCRRRRGEEGVVIRKQKREESLNKRRFLDENNLHPAANPLAASGAGVAAAAATNNGGMHVQAAAGTTGTGTNKPAVRLEDLPRYVQDMQSRDPQRELSATRAVRRLLSVEIKPPVEEVLHHGILPLLVEVLRRDDVSSDLQFEAAWALTNIASTNYTRTLVEAGATPLLARLLLSPSPDVREQCAWALGNIAGDCPELRDAVLMNQALMPLLKNIEQPSSDSMLRNCVWSLSNFCRGKPQPHIDVLRPALGVLAKVLASSKDDDCLQDAGWAVSYLSDGDNQRIQAVIDSGLVPDLVRLLGHQLTNVQTPMVRALGNLVSGDDSQTQAVLDAGALLYMPALLRNSKRAIRKETCWLLSNIAAGNPQQVNALCMTKSVLGMVLSQLTSAEFDVKKEAAWVISNVATGGGPSHVQHLVELGAMKPLSDLLDVEDIKMIEVALDALEAIFRAGKESEVDYVTLFHEADGPDRLERLQEHANERIYKRSVDLIENYLGVDEDEEEIANGGSAAGGGPYYQHSNPTVTAANGTFDFAAAAAAPGGMVNGGAGFNFSNTR